MNTEALTPVYKVYAKYMLAIIIIYLGLND